MASQPPDQGEDQQKVKIHVREDSIDMMDKMFAVINKPEASHNLSIPYKMRNLPPSFFKPPPSGSKSPSVHSRENSLDNGPFSPGPIASPGPPGSLGPVHNRTQSCPVIMGQPTDKGPQHQVLPLVNGQPQHTHLRNHSFDIGGGAEDLMGPLPPGWEKSLTATGQVYFLNHNNKTTQWEDPRKTAYANKMRQQQLNAAAAAAAASQEVAGQLHQVPANQLPMPDGWEMKVTEQGEKYYVDHSNKKTQWEHPAITLVNILP